MHTAARLACLAVASLAPAALAHDTPTFENPAVTRTGRDRLAVIVPAYSGDLSRAVSSLERWPSKCSPVTQENVDLVLYYAHTEGSSVEAAAAAGAEIAETAGRCFARTRTVYATLDEEDNVYPKGPSVQFYKMFLDEDVRPQLEEYDALAIIEWDVLVASDESFEQLYKAAFGGSEEFWMKGSNVGGTTFHDTAKLEDMWRVLGHINGNAIYNNNDPAFVEYIDYTRSRWQYDYPYDLALWLTISDFPYSWPLWQRFSNKFVTTNLISYVGLDRVDHDKVSDAVASNTLFLHGRRIDDGNLASIKATSNTTSRRRNRRNRKRRSLTSEPSDVDEDEARSTCSSMCDGGDDTGLPVGVSTFCDETCAGDRARFGGFLCGASNTERFGEMCRLCYTDVHEARKMEAVLADNGPQETLHVVMCDTKRPPEATDCDDHCALKSDTVCDESCGSGRHGDYNCNWRDHGAKCRFCFDDLDSALVADKVAMRHEGRVIMCNTMEPPQAEVVEIPELEKPALRATGKVKTEVQRQRKLQKWKENQKWKSSEKWKSASDEEEPKWKTNEKWRGNQGETSTSDVIPKWKEDKKWQGNEEEGIEPKWSNDVCLAGCDYTSSDGTRGRVCDDSCEDGIPNGTNGCGAKDGLYGNYCRVCYNDDAKAAKQSTDPDNPAIMCDSIYTRRLNRTPIEERASSVANKLEQWKELHTDPSGSAARGRKKRARKLQKWKSSEKWKSNEKWRDEAATSTEDTFEPKWKTQEKWRGNQGKTTTSDVTPKWKDQEKWRGDGDTLPKWARDKVCLAGCEYTSNDGSRGRGCDSSCSEGINGCLAKDGLYGDYCRVCYNDANKLAKQNTDTDNPAVTCASLNVYNNRRLEAVPRDSAPSLANKLETLKEDSESRSSENSEEGEFLPSGAVIGDVKAGDIEDTATFFAELAERQFTPELIRGNVCAFIPGGAREVKEWEVTVRSILQFLPGMRVAVAADSAGIDAYQSAVGNYPGVTVSLTRDVPTASLYADEYCGAGTSLIYYAQVRSLFSRTITSKDTHSTRGDLLVVYSDPLTVEDSKLVHLTTEVLGFKSSSFVQGADLILPVEANAELREVLSSEVGENRRGGSESTAVGFARLREFNNPAAVPQVMASLQYSRNTPGIWFVSPQQWVKQHLFQEASIWNIPLVKPRYTCSADATVLAAEEVRDLEVSMLLQRSLDFFSNGGTCENGRIAVEPAL